MLQDGEWFPAMIYTGTSLLGGIALVMLGMKIAELI